MKKLHEHTVKVTHSCRHRAVDRSKDRRRVVSFVCSFDWSDVFNNVPVCPESAAIAASCEHRGSQRFTVIAAELLQLDRSFGES